MTKHYGIGAHPYCLSGRIDNISSYMVIKGGMNFYRATQMYNATPMHCTAYVMARCLPICPSVCHKPVFYHND